MEVITQHRILCKDIHSFCEYVQGEESLDAFILENKVYAMGMQCARVLREYAGGYGELAQKLCGQAEEIEGLLVTSQDKK